MKSYLIPFIFVMASPQLAQAAVPDSGLIWEPQSVVYPVLPDAILPAPPFVPEESHETSGVIEVGPQKAATFFLDGLEIARVKVVSGSGKIRFQRVFGGSRSAIQTGLKATIDTGAYQDKDGYWQVLEPAGDGDVWSVDADTATRILVERPRTLAGRLSWEESRLKILSAIQKNLTIPELPGDDGSSAVRAELEAEAALGLELIRLRPELEAAVRAWRSAAALRALDNIRPFAWPYWSVQDLGKWLDGQGEQILRVDGEVSSSARWHTVDAQQAPVELEVEGPGILRVQSRAVLKSGWLVAPAPTTVRVFRDGILTRQQVYTGRPARVTDRPDLAFPMREVLITKTGDWAGKVNEIRIPLAPGKHIYRVQLDQVSLLRISKAERKPFAAEDLSNHASPEDWVQRGQRALQGKTGPEVELLLGLLSDVQGDVPPGVSAPLPGALSVVGEYLAAAYGKGPIQLERWTKMLAVEGAPSWAWWMRIKIASLLPEGKGVRALFAAARDLPPTGLLTPAALRLGAPGLYQDRPDRGLGALELAWRALPGDLTVRSAYLREFLDGSTWSRVSPVVLVNGDAITPPPMTWLDTAAGTGGPISRASRVFYRIPGGTTRTYNLAPNPANNTAPALLTVLLHTPAQSELVGLNVDDRSFRVLPLTDVERLDLAVPPGDHRVSLSAPAGSDAWVSGNPTEEQWRQIEDIASIRSYWSTTIRNSVPHFEVPSPQVSVPLRVELRSLDPIAHPEPVVAHVRTDTGADWPVVITPGTPDPTLLPIGGEPLLSSVATVTVYLPIGTQQAWVDAPQEANLVVSMSVRRTDFQTPLAEQTTAPSVATLDALTELSRKLLANPANPTLLLQRAQLLTDLGDTDMARQDLRRLLRLRDTAFEVLGDEAIDELSERLDNVGSSRWLSPVLDMTNVQSPVPLSAELVIGEDGVPPASVIELVHRLRKEGPEAVLAAVMALDAGSVGADWLRGRVLSSLDREVEAALSLVEAWRGASRWQYALEAASWLVASEVGSGQPPVAGVGSLGYGMAAEVREHIDHPTFERLALLAGRRTRWDTLRAVATSAGRARVVSQTAVTPPLPQTEIRQALTVAPWSMNESQFVTSKEPAQVTLPNNNPALAEVWCQPLRTGELAGEGEGACQVELAVDGVTTARQTIPALATSTLNVPGLAPGRHDIQVSIDDPGRVAALSVRFREGAGSRAVIRPVRETTGFLGLPSQPVSLSVAGPGAVYLELRSIGAQGGTVDIKLSNKQGSIPQPSVLLPREADPTIAVDAGMSMTAGKAAGAYVVLPTEGSWTITITPKTGTLLVRGAYRQETAPPQIQRPGPLWRDIPPTAEPFDWPATFPPMSPIAAVPAPMLWRAGTFSLETGFGREVIDEQTDTPVDQLTTSVAWRLQVLPRQLWLHLEPYFSTVGSTGSSWGVDADALARLTRSDLRFHVDGRYAQEEIAGNTEKGAKLSFRTYRPFRLGNGSYMIPSLEVLGRGQSLDTLTTTDVVDSRVYSPYTAQHPVALTPELTWWSMPWQDAIGFLTLSATTNSNVVSLDQVSFSAVGRTVIHPLGMPPVDLEARYRPTYRFADEYRLEGYLQHGVGGSLGVNLRLGNPMFLWLGVNDTLYLSGLYGTNNLFQFQARLDFNGGRGLNDRLPVEQDFGDLLSRERWGALNEDRL